MKNKHSFRTGILLVTICLAFLLSSCSEQYPIGKDTTLSVGNGKYQVLGGTPYGLFEHGVSICVDSNVLEYYDDTKGSKLYLICEDEYIVVDYKSWNS